MVFFFLESSSAKQQKTPKKKKSIQSYRALSDNYMKNKMFESKNDRQGKSLTGQVCDQAGHCPLTGHYFQPWHLTKIDQEKGKIEQICIWNPMTTGFIM